MKNGKRILSVTIKQMLDDSPDTSYLGEYSNSPKTEYAIDRAHDLDCASQTFNGQTARAKQILEHVQQTIGDLQEDYRKTHDQDFINDVEWNALEDAYNEVGELLDAVSECECDCGRGSWNRGEYQYFNPCHENYKGLDVEEIAKYCLQDYDRMESLNNGNWYYIGIRAEAEIGLPSNYTQAGKPILMCQKITSGGLWGIESDSDRDYLESVEKDELADLKTQLKGLGFSARAISMAFKNVEKKEAR